MDYREQMEEITSGFEKFKKYMKGDFYNPETGEFEHDWHNFEFLIFPYTAHGDYTGDLVTRVNYESIANNKELAMFFGHGVLVEYGEDYNTNMIMVNLENLPLLSVFEPEAVKRAIAEIRDIVGTLADYPILDDNLHSRMQLEIMEETLSDIVNEIESPQFYNMSELKDSLTEFLHGCSYKADFIDYSPKEVEEIIKKHKMSIHDAMFDLLENYTESEIIEEMEIENIISDKTEVNEAVDILLENFREYQLEELIEKLQRKLN